MYNYIYLLVGRTHISCLYKPGNRQTCSKRNIFRGEFASCSVFHTMYFYNFFRIIIVEREKEKFLELGQYNVNSGECEKYLYMFSQYISRRLNIVEWEWKKDEFSLSHSSFLLLFVFTIAYIPMEYGAEFEGLEPVTQSCTEVFCKNTLLSILVYNVYLHIWAWYVRWCGHILQDGENSSQKKNISVYWQIWNWNSMSSIFSFHFFHSSSCPVLLHSLSSLFF